MYTMWIVLYCSHQNANNCDNIRKDFTIYSKNIFLRNKEAMILLVNNRTAWNRKMKNLMSTGPPIWLAVLVRNDTCSFISNLVDIDHT
ncbi:hypothetical protein GBFDFA_13785 [Edwardsiella anguillarum]|nr:hypothetical protein QY76_06505 [Edwardsiella sp. EA181011]RFT04641.1 hypothetical protein CGL57_04825 [Edwardsiella anguillarum]BET81768.1 hypothetical protein PBOPBF_13100 [Edwardsiella anguillarum]BET85197.1 hypothetical protein GHNJMD_14115 [Edwardsiella anguillarum]BET88560.1 hypothetical protein GBFDFA_13785 [Edwardsiella anguillarum]